jgi:perosamine synthetase
MGKFIQNASPALIGNEKKYVLDCLNSNWISSSGKYINKFEKEFAKYHNLKYAVSCNSGTAAIHISLLALDIKKGDEVITTALTYVATINAINYCGAKAILVDIEPDTWCIDVEAIEKSITSKTKAIIVVHLFGHPVNMDKIMMIAKKHKLFIIEDNAQGLGAKYKNKLTGSFGHISTFSFFGSKLITTGEGGMLLTNNKNIADKARIYKSQGQEPGNRYWFPVIGYNYRMTNIEAALGLAQLEKINIHIKNRLKIVNLYFKELREIDNISLPVEKENFKSVYWMFNIYLKDKVKKSRDEIIRSLIKKNIEARYIPYPLNTLPPYREVYRGKSYPIALKVSERSITLPTHENLTEKDIKYISDCLKKYLL